MPERDELDQACFELAHALKWSRTPIDVAEISALGQQLAKDARSFVSEPLGIDIPLIARAVRYVTEVHAMPEEVESTYTLMQMLTVVLEIARPNSGMSDRAMEFLRDMREGIDSALGD